MANNRGVSGKAFELGVAASRCFASLPKTLQLDLEIMQFLNLWVYPTLFSRFVWKQGRWKDMYPLHVFKGAHYLSVRRPREISVNLQSCGDLCVAGWIRAIRFVLIHFTEMERGLKSTSGALYYPYRQ